MISSAESEESNKLSQTHYGDFGNPLSLEGEKVEISDNKNKDATNKRKKSSNAKTTNFLRSQLSIRSWPWMTRHQNMLKVLNDARIQK